MIKLIYGAQVVDDETGTTIKGAYWRSETLEGEILLELEEGGNHEGYMLVEDGSVIHARGKETAGAGPWDDADFESVFEDFRVVVAKKGYVTLVRQFTASVNVCHIWNVEGDHEFRLVKGPPGEDDIFRTGR